MTADGGGPFFPVIQFERHRGQVRVRPALQEFMTVLRSLDRWTVAVLIHTPALELDGQSPIGWSRRGGDLDPIRDYAATVLSEFRS